jgi:hypothetical protein
MEGDPKHKCQWSNCGSVASKHAVLALSVFDAKDDVHVSEAPYLPEHFDLCGRHLELAHLQYVHVNEYELGCCPQDQAHGRT